MTILNEGCGSAGWPWGDLFKVAKLWWNRDKNGDAGAEPEGSIPAGDDKNKEEPSWIDDIVDAGKAAGDAVKEMLETGPGQVAKEAGGDLIGDMTLEDALGKSVFDLANKSAPMVAFKSGLSADFTDALGDFLPSDTSLKGGLLMGYDSGIDVALYLKATKTFNVWTPELPGISSQVCTTFSTNMWVKLDHDLTGSTGGNLGGGLGGTISLTDFQALGDTWAEDLGADIEFKHDLTGGGSSVTIGITFDTGS